MADKTTVSWYQIVDPAAQRAVKQLQLALQKERDRIELIKTALINAGITLPGGL